MRSFLLDFVLLSHLSGKCGKLFAKLSDSVFFDASCFCAFKSRYLLAYFLLIRLQIELLKSGRVFGALIFLPIELRMRKQSRL